MSLLRTLERRLDGWKARLISRAGKLQLIKTVLSSVPTYFMSCFSLPNWLIARIDTIRRQFLWTRPQTTTRIHLLNWPSVCLLIQNGGLGVLNLQLQNTSLLLRWLWRLYQSDRKLWSTYASRIYGSHYHGSRPLILSSNGSFFWTSLIKIKPIFHSSVSFRIVSGKETSFWYDAWAGQPLATQQSGTIPQRAISVFQARNCFHQLIPAPFTLHQHEAFQKINSAPFGAGPDVVTWQLSTSGTFSVKSIYTILSQGGKLTSTFHSIWKSKVTPSMSLFFFLLLRNKLLTHEVMLKRRITHTPGCVLCAQCSNETAVHLFFLCPFVRGIWLTLATSLGYAYALLTPRDTPLLTYLASAPPDKERRKSWIVYFIAATYFIWRERNSRTFKNNASTQQILAAKILHEAALCLKHC